MRPARSTPVRGLAGASLALCASLLLAATAASAAPSRVTLLPSGPASIRFVVEVPEPELRSATDHPEWQNVRLEGYTHGTRAGEPDLPSRIVMVAVPPTGVVRVSGFTRGAAVHERVDLAPTPTFERAASGAVERLVRPEGARPFTPPPAVELLDVSWVRDQRVAVVAVRPASWDEPARRLQVASQVEVALEVDAAAASATHTPRVALDPFEGTYETTLVNYEQGRRWRRPAVAAAGPMRLDAGALSELDGGLPEDCLFAGRTWVKIAIPSSGFYKVGFGQFRSLAAFGGIDSLATDSLRLFAWEGDPVYPETGNVDSCRYREVAIQFLENGDGVLTDNNEEIYFYAQGPSDWANVFNPAAPESVFLNHPYETRNYYFLTRGTPEAPFAGPPARITPQDASVVIDGSETTPPTFDARIHVETDLVPFPNLSPKSGGTSLAWEKFFWTDLAQGRGFPLKLLTPGIETSIPARVRILMWGIDAYPPCPTFYPDHLLDVTVNSVAMPRHSWFGYTQPSIFEADVALEDSNDVRVAIPSLPACPARIDASALAWAQVRYTRRFEPVANALAFDSPVSGGTYLYRIGPFSQAAPPRVFDVTDAFAPRELTGLLYENQGGGAYQLSFETVESGQRRYRIFPDGSVPKLAATEIRDASILSASYNLRSSTLGADFVVIYYDEFRNAAETLRSWRETHLPIDGDPGPYQTLALPVSAIYDQFTGGRLDPGAIRSLLRHAFYNWSPRPAFVTLVGDGSYDFKNILGRAGQGRPGALVPSFQDGFAINAMFATDDWLMDVTSGGAQLLPDFYAGRIPTTDAPQAQSVIDRKVIAYEQSAPLGPHRNRVMLIADDETQGHRRDALLWTHLRQTATVDNSRIPEHFDRSYVYLHKYGYGPGSTKPAAKEAIRRSINDGVVLFNYFGHGSPFKLADEDVLLDTDAGTLDNADRLALFLAASCDVGKFDDPRVPSLGERMVLSLNGGAVAVVSATELAYSFQNSLLANAFYRFLFERSTLTGQYYQSVSQALLNAKLTGAVGAQNSQKYLVMGDGATRLNLPRRSVEVSLHACDTCTTPLTIIPKGSTVTYRGRVLESPGGAAVALDGVADLLIEDAAPLEQAPPCRLPEDQPFCGPDTLNRPLYYYRAGAMFRGNVQVRGGVFSGQFLVPLDSKEGPRAKSRAYVTGAVPGVPVESDGAGDVMTQVVGGSPPAGDNTGPTINLSFGGGATSVRPDAKLQIDLFDASGILITGHSPQNGIIVTVDGNTTARTDVTGTFRYAAGSYQSGTATFQLPNLAPGPHTVRVSAADNLAAGIGAASHRSEATLAFEVSDLPPLSIGHAYLFPNPTRSGGPGSGGQFVVEARGDSLNALLRVYTISGKLIRTLTVLGGLGQTQVEWDGLDDEGRALANGTYFFRVQVNARDEQGRSSARQRAVAEGRFIVLN